MENIDVSMRGGVSWEVNKGVTYLSVNFSGLDDVATLNVALELAAIMSAKELGSIRILTDLSDMYASYNVYSTLRKLAKSHQQYIFKSAIIGLSPRLLPFYKIHQSVARTKAKVFELKTDALDYICS